MINTADWDSSIRKVPLNYQGTKSNAWSVQREDWIEENNGENTITAPVWKEVGVVSDKYLLINNKDVVDIIESIAEASQYNFKHDKMFWNGKQFMYSMTTSDVKYDVDVGDDVSLGMMIWNSYDGSTALQFKLYLQRLVCLNGMVSNDIFKSYKFKHNIGSENYQEEIMESVSMIEDSQVNIRHFINGLRRMNEDNLNAEKLALIRQEYIPNLPVSLFGNVIDKLLSYRPHGKLLTYDLLNAATNVLWHKKKQTKADFDHNAYVVDNLIKYVNSDYFVPTS